MATDPWYLRELVADVPAEEWEAAVETEDWDEEEQGGEEGDEAEEGDEEEEDDPSYSEEEDEESEDGSDSELEGSGDFMECEIDLEASDASGDTTPRTRTPKNTRAVSKDAEETAPC